MNWNSSMDGFKCLWPSHNRGRKCDQRSVSTNHRFREHFTRFHCLECGEWFPYRDDLEVHRLIVHNQDLEDRPGAEKVHYQKTGAEVEAAEIQQLHVQEDEISNTRHRFDKQEMDNVSRMILDSNREESINRMIPVHMSSYALTVLKALCFADFETSRPPRCGPFRGIQGENNSCYIDACLMAMFYANDTFDSCLSSALRPNAGTTVSAAEPKQKMPNRQPQKAKKLSEDLKYAQKFLAFQIVNNLRGRGFVPSLLVVEWRRMMEHVFRFGLDFETHCERQEASEFVEEFLHAFATSKDYSVTMKRCKKVNKHGPKPENNSISTFMIQTFPPPNAMERVFSTEELLCDFRQSQGLKFHKLGTSLIIQPPRYGSNDRLLRGLVPSPQLTLKDESPKHPSKIFELRAVLAIGTGHFVTYIRVPERNEGSQEPNSGGSNSSDTLVCWLYFDSMSDRQFGQNVPLLEDVTNELQVLEYPNADRWVEEEALNAESSVNKCPEAKTSDRPHLRRITQDACLMFYSQVPTQQKETSHGSTRRKHSCS